MIVFEIHYNFLIVLPIPLKTCRSGVVFFFLQSKRRAPEKLGASQRFLRARSASGVQFVQACNSLIRNLAKVKLLVSIKETLQPPTTHFNDSDNDFLRS